MVVHTRPDALDRVKNYIRSLPGSEIHGSSEAGKIVVVLESSAQRQITDTLDQINQFPQVLGTALVYHQIDVPEPDQKDDS